MNHTLIPQSFFHPFIKQTTGDHARSEQPPLWLGKEFEPFPHIMSSESLWKGERCEGSLNGKHAQSTDSYSYEVPSASTVCLGHIVLPLSANKSWHPTSDISHSCTAQRLRAAWKEEQKCGVYIGHTVPGQIFSTGSLLMLVDLQFHSHQEHYYCCPLSCSVNMYMATTLMLRSGRQTLRFLSSLAPRANPILSMSMWKSLKVKSTVWLERGRFLVLFLSV